ncbi:MAG: GlxA family transcriptional regulator [Aestuariibacter sp.]
MFKQRRIFILALPETVATPLVGISDILNAIPSLNQLDPSVPSQAPYNVSFVSESGAEVCTASNITVKTDYKLTDMPKADAIILPSIVLPDNKMWVSGRYPALTNWLKNMHFQGAEIYTACSGVFLLAETGLLDGKEATLHWAHTDAFSQAFPNVRVNKRKMIVYSGGRAGFVMSGAASSWQDLVLHMVARHLGSSVSYILSKFFALQWQSDGQSPFEVFLPNFDHDDAVILRAQEWLAEHFSFPNPVEEMVRVSGISERSFTRRFDAALSLTPIKYVQHLRIEQAKRQLESGTVSIEDISWRVGYEDPAFFRRLFKRITGLTPGMYRKNYATII